MDRTRDVNDDTAITPIFWGECGYGLDSGEAFTGLSVLGPQAHDSRFQVHSSKQCLGARFMSLLRSLPCWK